MPNFLVIGAAKAGTTALYHYLQQHPQIYMSPIKETNFFALEGETPNFGGPGSEEQINRYSIAKLEEYQALFQEVNKEIAIGEVSPFYLYHPQAPERIKHYIKDVKLIAILRNPVDRAYASFMQMIRDSRESITNFSEALQAEKERIERNWDWIWHYQAMGFYYSQLSSYFEMFDRKQIRVYLYEDWHVSNIRILQDIFIFLDVDESFVPDMSVKPNVSGIPKNQALHKLLKKPNSIKSMLKPFYKSLLPTRMRQRIRFAIQNPNLAKPPPISTAVRQQLIEAFREDII